MVIEFQKEKTRKRIGAGTIYCPVCGKPLSFRDETPFCRTENCPFTKWHDGIRAAQIIETIRRC